MQYSPKKALIVGAGAGLSAAVARLLAKDGVEISLAARTPDDLSDLCSEVGAKKCLGEAIQICGNSDADGRGAPAQIRLGSGTPSVTYSCIQDDDPIECELGSLIAAATAWTEDETELDDLVGGLVESGSIALYVG